MSIPFHRVVMLAALVLASASLFPTSTIAQVSSIEARFGDQAVTIENRWRCDYFTISPDGDHRTVDSLDDRCGKYLSLNGEDGKLVDADAPHRASPWRFVNAVDTNEVYIHSLTGCGDARDGRCGKHLSFAGDARVLTLSNDASRKIPWEIIPINYTTDQFWIRNEWHCDRNDDRCGMTLGFDGDTLKLLDADDYDHIVPWRIQRWNPPVRSGCAEGVYGGRPTNVLDPERGQLFIWYSSEAYSWRDFFPRDRALNNEILTETWADQGCNDWRAMPPDVYRLVWRQTTSSPMWGAQLPAQSTDGYAVYRTTGNPGGEMKIEGGLNPPDDGRYKVLMYRWGPPAPPVWVPGIPEGEAIFRTGALANFVSTRNAAILGYNTIHLTGVSPQQCAVKCLKEQAFNCVSFDYYKGKKKCDLSDKRASDVGGLKTNYAGNPYDHYSLHPTPSGYTKVNNAAIPGYNTKRLKGVNPQDCAAACDREPSFRCLSFDYHKYHSTCDLSDQDGPRVGGLKTNYKGDPYDHYEHQARAAQGRFTKTANAAIKGHNRKRLSGMKPKECMSACLGETRFRCVSFDYHKEKKWCDLSDKRASDVGGLKTNYAGNPYDHYSR